MIAVAQRFARLAPALVLVALLSAEGCSSSQVACPCGTGGYASVTVPAAENTPIAAVSTDPPCTAMDGGGGTIVVVRGSVGTCQVRVRLASDDTYVFSVQFRASGAGCCPDLVTAVDASVPTLVDAGTAG